MSDGRGADVVAMEQASGALADEANGPVRVDEDRPVAPTEAPPGRESDMPRWALILGTILALLFVELSAQAYFGRSTVDRVMALAPRRERLADTAALQAFYVAREEQAKRGMLVTDADGRDRPLLIGDLVLVGDLGKLMRLERDGGSTIIEAAGGSAIQVANLGPWDMTARRLDGLAATFGDGRWDVARGGWPPASRDFRARGGAQTELPAGFWRSPGDAPAQMSAQRDGNGTIYRFEMRQSMPYVVVTSQVPLADLDNVPITVLATARAQAGATLTLTVYDVYDAPGNSENYNVRRAATGDWEELRLSLKARFPSPGDNFSIGLFEVQPNDWFEVRGFELFLGLLP